VASRRIIAVVGATGAQGGGLACAILSDPARSFTVRALTRRADSDKAKALADLGATVVHADLDDVASLTSAFRGAHAAYCVTNFWEHFSPEKELAQAKNLATAAPAAELEHVVWSTLENTRQWIPVDDPRMPTLLGKYKVPHFDAKGEADRYFSDLRVPTTFLLTSFYWDNLVHFGMGPKPDADGVLAITLPMADKRLPGIAAEDIGKCAYGVFRRGLSSVGKTIGIAGEHLTGQDMAAALSKVLGRQVRYNAVPAAAYRRFGFPGADDLGNMFQFKCEFNDYFCGVRDVAEARMLNPALQTFEQWLESNKNKISLS
jgi:uncharacterized protein YbjT (DUF2867 family)